MNDLMLSEHATPTFSQAEFSQISSLAPSQTLNILANNCTFKPTEIGSEFWNAPLSGTSSLFSDANTQFVISGRTALDLTARDLIAEKKIKSICLPAYCCSSMITPFERMGLEIMFYDVYPTDNGIHRNLSPKHGCDAVLLLDYFGFSQLETVELSKREHEHGVVVILDQVQSQFSFSDSIHFADYTITSWRKWFFSCGAAVTKRYGAWSVKPTKPANAQYVSLRKKAAELKTCYLHKGEGEKQEFLSRFSQAEQLLDNDYSDYYADPESIDAIYHLNLSFLKQCRRNNAALIYDALLNLNDERIRPLFPPPAETDTPLFVPVLVKPDIRISLRNYLIQNEVFCPIHWPSAETRGAKALYAKELSLICDQRYNIENMKREMNLIKEFFTHYV